MTVLAAAIDDQGRIALGSDTRGFGAYGYDIGPKIRQWGSWLVGSSGALLWFRFLDEIAPKIDNPHSPEALADAWLAWARDRGHGGQDPDHHLGVDGELLLAKPGKIVRIGCDGCVIRHTEHFATAGSGGAIAIGAMHSLRHALHITEPRFLVEQAVAAAIAYGPGCGGRVHIETFGYPPIDTGGFSP